MSFDEIFDLTAGVYFNFYNIYIRRIQGRNTENLVMVLLPKEHHFFFFRPLRSNCLPFCPPDRGGGGSWATCPPTNKAFLSEIGTNFFRSEFWTKRLDPHGWSYLPTHSTGKRAFSCMFLFAEDYRMMTSCGEGGAPFFRRFGRELVLKPAISLKKSWED